MLEWQVWMLQADISLGHRAWRKANSDSTGRARRRYSRPRSLSRPESMTWGRTRRGPRSINADDSGSEEERAAGGAGPGAVDPGERGGLTDRMTADCCGAGPNITCVGRTYGMVRVDHSVAELTSF